VHSGRSLLVLLLAPKASPRPTWCGAIGCGSSNSQLDDTTSTQASQVRPPLAARPSGSPS
jgi:hypothetical protein